MADDTKTIEFMKEMFSDLYSKMDEENSLLHKRIDCIENKVDKSIEELVDIKKRVIKTETILENETNKNIKLLSEVYPPMTEDIHQLKDDFEVVKFDVDVVKKVVTTHSTELNKLKKAK